MSDPLLQPSQQPPPGGSAALPQALPQALPRASPPLAEAQTVRMPTPKLTYGSAEPGHGIDTGDQPPIQDVVYGVCVQNLPVATKNAFLLKAYGFVLLHVSVMVGFACACLYAPALRQYCREHVDLTYLALILLLVVVLPPFCFAALRDTAPWNGLIYGLFVGCTTFIFGFATAYNESEATLQAMIAITITVATLAACALQTERDIVGGWWSYGLPFIVSAIVLGFGRFVWPSVAVGPAVGAALLSAVVGAALVYEAGLLIHRLTPEQWMCASLSMILDLPNLLIHLLSLATRHTRAS